jgi:hypothetical protein
MRRKRHLFVCVLVRVQSQNPGIGQEYAQKAQQQPESQPGAGDAYV